MINAHFLKIQSIFLVGFRASGKSTIGIVLAKALTDFFAHSFEKQVEIYGSRDILESCSDKLLNCSYDTASSNKNDDGLGNKHNADMIVKNNADLTNKNNADLTNKNAADLTNKNNDLFNKNYNSSIIKSNAHLACNKSNDFLNKRWAWVDTDSSIIEHLGQDIESIVAENGWDYFRMHESSILQNCKAPYTVFSTGGGIVLSPENCKFMKQQGYVIYLKASSDTIVKRLQANPQKSQRPALTDESLELEVENILKSRIPLYEGVSDIIVDAELSVNNIVNNILKQYVANYLACFKK